MGMIRLIEKEDLGQIVALHHRILEWSINGRLGRDHVAAMYAALFAGEDVFGFVSQRGDKIQAFMSATTNFRAARTRLSATLGLFGRMRILSVTFSRPLDLIDLFEATFLLPRAMSKHGYSAELLTWVADFGNPLGALVGFGVMANCLQELRRRGVRFCYAQVMSSNEAPNRFHRRMGSRILQTYLRNRLYLVDCSYADEMRAMIPPSLADAV